MKEITLIEKSDSWEIMAKDWTITQCKVDYAFTIESWSSNDSFLSIRIEGRFNLKTASDEYDLYAEDGPTTICRALNVLHQKIETLAAYKTGMLRIIVSNGIQISVPSDPNYEAWTLSGSRGLLIVCEPGGTLAVWKPE